MNGRLIGLISTALILDAFANSSFSQSNKEKSPQPLGNVVDNAGKTLGPIVGASRSGGGIIILLRVEGKVTSLQLQPLELDEGRRVDYNKLVPTASGDVMFADFECMGTAYFQPGSTSVPGTFPSVSTGDKFGAGFLYVGGESLEMNSVQFRSRFSSTFHQCINGEGAADFVIPALHIVDLTSTFASPYSVK